MADVRVVMDPAAIAAMASDWAGPVGQIIERVTAEVHHAAKAMAPVSARGSKYAPSGFLRSRVTMAHAEDSAGVLGLVGIPKDNRGSRYPYPFLHSASGTRKVRNGWSRPGTVYKIMSADNVFLETALESATSMFGGY